MKRCPYNINQEYYWSSQPFILFLQCSTQSC